MRITDWTPGARTRVQGERARLLAAWAEGVERGMEIMRRSEGLLRDWRVDEEIALLNAVHELCRYAEGGGLGREPSQEDVDRVFGREDGR